MEVTDAAEWDEAETTMPKLVDGAGLAAPDDIRREKGAREMVLLWHEPTLAVVIEMDDE